MKRIMLKRSILNIRMLFVIVTNFIILFVSLFEYGIITVDGKTPGTTYDILTMYTIPFAISSFINVPLDNIEKLIISSSFFTLILIISINH